MSMDAVDFFLLAAMCDLLVDVELYPANEKTVVEVRDQERVRHSDYRAHSRE